MADEQPVHNNNGGMKRYMLYFTAIVIATTLCIIIYWYGWGRYTDSTDDAYVHGNLVNISPQISGIVSSVNTDTMRYVKEGQILIEIDKTDFEIRFKEMSANLANTVRDVSKLFEEYDQKKADLITKKTEKMKAEIDYEDRKNLVEDGAVSKEEYIHAKLFLEETTSMVESAKASLSQVYALLQGTILANHPLVIKDANEVKKAFVDLSRCTIKSPCDGIVSKRVVQVGSFVQPLDLMMAVVPLNQMWVEANFREVDISQVRMGQLVKITSDLYGSGVVYNGHVVGIDGGTGAAFSLIPPQNATGNWIKIVQRIPVRIDLDPVEISRFPLRIGMSMYVTVDTHDQYGARVPSDMGDSPVYYTNIYGNQQDGVDAIIQDIIKKNASIPLDKVIERLEL
ncbi:MAG: efflux RND transporter periplasmic adaptor subunit [Chlamydiales bacterium]|nr:efflux RND transporter periplasmic adaptor subunit [Chlamydiales bacterium]